MVPPPHTELDLGEKPALARNKAAPGGTSALWWDCESSREVAGGDPRQRDSF